LGTGSLNFIQACSPNSFTRLWKIFMSQSWYIGPLMFFLAMAN
jgi:hypothetical protein